MDCTKFDKMLSNLYVFHRFFKKTGFSYECCSGRRKITFDHHLTLMILKNRGKLSMSEISVLIGTNKQKMTYIMDILVGNGMVKRVPDMGDRRIVNIIITDIGIEYLNNLQKNKIHEMKTIFTDFTDEDLKNLYESIENIKDILIIHNK